MECIVFKDGKEEKSWSIPRDAKGSMVIEWLKTMSSETFDDVDKRRMFNPCSGPDLVYINGRPLLVFKSDGFSSVVRISAEEIQYTG